MGWVSGWSKRKKLIIDYSKIDAELTDFPLMIHLASDVGLTNIDVSDIFDELDYGPVNDDFTGTNGDSPNSDRWNEIETTNGTIQIYNNELKFELTSSAYNEYPNAPAFFNFPGDFNVQVDFTSVNVAGDGNGIELFCKFSDGNDFFIKAGQAGATQSFLWRFQVGGTKYSGNTPRTNSYGKFRLIRSGNTCTIKYRDGSGDWQTVGSRTDLPSTAGHMRLGFWHGTDANAASGTLDNFIVNSGEIDWEEGKFPNRKKILLTDDSDASLYVEIDHWNQYNKEAFLWGKIPTVYSDKDTVLYLYYDSSHADNTTYVGDTGDSAAQNVWDSDFEGVFHLSQDPASGGTEKDSTSHARNMTSEGSMTSDDLVDGSVGKAVDLDGTNDYIRGGDWFYSNALTIEAFFRTDVLDQLKIIGVKRNIGSSGNANEWALDIESNREIAFGAWSSSGLSFSARSPILVSSTSEFYYAAGKCDGSFAHAFLNERRGGGDTQDYTIQNTTSEIQIGCQSNGDSSRFFNGLIDEFRVSSIARPDAYIKATNYTLKDELLRVENGWLVGFKNRIKLTIDHTKFDSSLEWFPLSVHLSDSCGLTSFDVSDVFNEIGENYRKMAVTTSDGETQLFVNVQKWDAASTEAWLVVGVPLISDTSDVVLYLYYDVDAPDQIWSDDLSLTNDDFTGTDNDSPDKMKWKIQYGSPEITSNTLSWAASSSDKKQFVMNKFMPVGNFDVRVTCHLDSTPSSDWWSQTLSLVFPDHDNHWCYVGRLYTSGDGQIIRSRYNKGSSTTVDFDTVAATDYQLRLTRDVDTIYFYYKTTGDWVSLGSVQMYSESPIVRITGETGNNNPSVSGYFDDFEMYSADRITGHVGPAGSWAASGVWDENYIFASGMRNAVGRETIITAPSSGNQGLVADGTYFYWGKDNGSGVDGTIYQMDYSGNAVANFAGPPHCAGGSQKGNNIIFCSGGSDPYEIWEISGGSKVRSWDLSSLDYGQGGLVATISGDLIYAFTSDTPGYKIREVILNNDGTYSAGSTVWSSTSLGTPQGLTYANNKLYLLADHNSQISIYELLLRSDGSIDFVEYTTGTPEEGEGLDWDGEYFYFGTYTSHKINRVQDLTDMAILKATTWWIYDEALLGSRNIWEKKSGGEPAEVDTSYCGGQSFDYVDDYIAGDDIHNFFGKLGTGDFTIETFAKVDVGGHWNSILSVRVNGTTPLVAFRKNSSDKLELWKQDDGGDDIHPISTGSISAGSYHYLVGRLTGNTGTTRIDGSADGTDTNSSCGDATLPTSNALVISAKYGDGTYDFWDGIIDSIRVSTIHRSDAWVDASRLSVLDGLVSLSSVESIGKVIFEIDKTKIDGDLTHFPLTLLLNSYRHNNFFDEMIVPVNDDFTGTDGDSPNGFRWEIAKGAPSINSDKLDVSVDSTDQDSLVRSKYRLEGDFDIQIDFLVPSLPTSERWCLNFFVKGEDGTNYKIRPEYGGDDIYNYHSFRDGTQGYLLDGKTVTTDTSGKLRITRVGDAFKSYYWNGSSWTQNGSGLTISNMGKCKVAIKGEWFQGSATDTLQADNLLINSGKIYWPGGYRNKLRMTAVVKGLSGELYVELEEFDETKFVAYASKSDWVIKQGAINRVYLYYDSELKNNDSYVGDIGDTPAQAVWDSDFKAVYHMSQDPTGGSGCILDSTLNGNNGTPAGSMTSWDLVDGQVGKALDFDGTDDDVDCGNDSSFNFASAMTVEALLKPTAIGTRYGIIEKHTTPDYGWWFSKEATDEIKFLVVATNERHASSTSTLIVDWAHVVGTYDGSDIGLLVNGVDVTGTQSGTGSGNITNDTQTVAIGNLRWGPYPFNGLIDEVRLSDIVRADAWLKATNYSLTGELIKVIETGKIQSFGLIFAMNF